MHISKNPPEGRELWRAEYPFESHWFATAGHRLHYIDEGQGDPILLVHGNPTWSFYWRELVKSLRPFYRVIALDHIGCGLSDKPQDYKYTLRQRIDDLLGLIAYLKLERITLVAQDWGGAIGMGAAVRIPQRFARFVLSNTGAFRSQRMPWRIRICRTPVVGPWAVRGLNAFSRAALHMAIEHPERLTENVKSGYLAPYDSWANRVAVDRFVQDIPMRRSHPSYQTLADIEQSLPVFRDHPCLFIWGMRDWCFTPQFLDQFLSYYSGADVVRLRAAGHWALEDAPQEFIAAVRGFMAKHSRVMSVRI